MKKSLGKDRDRQIKQKNVNISLQGYIIHREYIHLV